MNTTSKIDPVTIKLPGAFWSYFEGSGLYQGDPYYEDEREPSAAALREAARSAKSVKAGKGFYVPVVIDDLWALAALANYADMCIECNTYGDCYPSELAAARTVLGRILDAAGDRLEYARYGYEVKS